MQIGITEGQIKVTVDHNSTCDNICQRSMSMEGICETEIVNNWKKYTKKSI